MKRLLNYINGEHIGNSSRSIEIVNPAKGETISQVILSNKNDFDHCIKSSLKAIKVIRKERKKANCHSSMYPMILKFFKVEI